ncbi:bifunctional (p)ppGpp synthetase/guanosine-3',5'-bis(diphosphate) 3'-pyrophosphohydrolase [Candidatus Tisiphia endosymbiont of Dioctria linearis]|uniref:bifunctional (p)ppGpp synthetase/guanosine-3',5'-bis(diphosphate) 3'-pyrophosphohydrolase n=2 Tax=unclassified Candidatus Tisiphia TaxID=2996318 RepID=UPI00312C9135|nr:bifunctional (p)ppGpp synthetase/guanosine-3',5'-bis(diphosphate) 3'-pyrophosphohydrolase [Rickettsia endosymbiont of Platyusa sonomae]
MSFMLYNFHKIVSAIGTSLHENSIVENISYRLKDPTSVLKKLLRKNIDFHQLNDLVALRIIVDKQEDCYKVLDIIHDLYPNNLEKYKDYIINPKHNGYSSLHTVAAVGTPGRNVEIQIRTNQMHDIAEFGTASHGEYKKSQEARIEELFSTTLSNIDAIYRGLNNAYKLFEQFNWTMLELVAYEQEIQDVWNNCQDDLQAIREQLLEE